MNLLEVKLSRTEIIFSSDNLRIKKKCLEIILQHKETTQYINSRIQWQELTGNNPTIWTTFSRQLL